MAAVNLAQLFSLVPESRNVVPVPSAQPVDRDLAIVVAESTPVGELLQVVRAAAGPMLREARVFDAYRGAQVGEGRVSYAVSLRFQPDVAGDERSVERALNRVSGSVKHHLAAEIR
jgi:phenylalanyl-tRNA synthetase beta chain